MKLLAAITIFLAALSACSGGPSSTPAIHTTVDDAQTLVGLDDHAKTLADKDDIRVKRVRYLLDHLASVTSEDEHSIAAATDHTSSWLEDRYGRFVSRQDLLEEMSRFYTDPSPAAAGHKYGEILDARAMMLYAK